MNNKIFIIMILCMIITLCFTSCGIPNISEYHTVSGNIVWNEGYKIDTKFPGRIYYEIEGVPTEEYIACKWRDKGIGVESVPILMKHKDFEGNWELDASSAKLIISESGHNLSDDEWSSIEQNIIVQEVYKFDGAIAEQLANSIISADYIEYKDLSESGILFNLSNYICDSEGHFLRLHFTLKDYDALSWIACILKYDDTYYIEIKEDIHNPQFLVCSDEFAALLDEVCNEYDLNANR